MITNAKRLFAFTIAAFAAAFASTTAFAVRYWKGGQEGALFSDPSNWFSNDTGSTATSKPDTTKGVTYWFNNGSTVFDMTNANANRTVFDGAEAVADKVNVGTGSESPFIWSATDPSYGLANGGNEFRIGYNKTPSYLQIDSGTYSFGIMLIGYTADTTSGLTLNGGTFTSSGNVVIGNAANTTAGLTLNGGTFTSSGTTRIGYATPATARLTVNGGEFVTGKVRVGGGKSNVDGTLTITNGTFKITGTGDDMFMMCDQANTRGTLVIEGGTVDATSCNYIQMGGMTDTTSTILITGGTLETQGFVVGGKARNSVNSADNAVARLVVDGGTLNASGECHIGTTAGSGVLSEMVVSNGAVNVGGAYIYIGRMASGSLAMEGGELNVKGFLVGGKEVGNGDPIAGDDMVSRLVVNGGTINAGANCSIGSVTGAVVRSEMIVSNGVVNINADNLYVGDRGPGALIMEGGEINIKDTDSYGLSLGHCNNGVAVGTVTLNGGTIKARKVRLTYTQPGSRIIFNGGTLKATRDATSYLDANANLTCEVQAGGLVFDTDGHNVTIAHDIVGSGPLIKKGAGKLTISGAHPFELGNVFVCEGSVVLNGTTYSRNSGVLGTVVDASEGGDLGTVKLHGDALDGWLNDTDFASYATYGADGKHYLEQPLSVLVSVNGTHKYYHNLETGRTYNDTLDGVSYSFTTEDLAPRTLRVLSTVNNAAVLNVRDIGSWPLVSVDGPKKMNQGLIYRGGHLDAFVNATEDQKAASALAGLKTEIDLRKPADEIPEGYLGVTQSWAATNANYYNFSLVDSQLNAGSNFTNQLRNVFSTLGTPGALPAYFHCMIGRDRTGVVGRLLLGLMGVEEEVMYRDYLASNFANLDGTCAPATTETTLRYLLRGECGGYVFTGKDAEYGVSVASRCRQYLEMCGVTYEEIKNITTALSGETPEQVLARVDAYETANGFRTVSYVPYEGSASTNATHRLAAGKHILPTSTPTRTGYMFVGWDTENEADGIVYAKWKDATCYWAETNGESESFTRAASWSPALAADGEFDPDGILVINRGVGKVAVLSEGSAAVNNIYVGWGSFDGGVTFAGSNDTSDRCGRLDIADGVLSVTNYLYVGGYRTTKGISSVVNVSGGRLAAGRLHVGDYSASGDRCDALNISGTGVVEVTASDIKVASEYESGGAVAKLRITDDGVLRGVGAARFGEYGRGTAVLEDNAVLDVTGMDVFLGKGSGTHGEISLADSASLSFYDMRVGYDASSTGIVTVEGGNNATNITAGHYIYIGRKGTGTLTINSGVVSVASAVQIGYDGVSTTAGTLNLNGGKLITRQMKIVGTPATAVFNWNGGVLEYSAASGDSTVDIMPNSALAVNVLEGGAIYNAVVRDNEIINHALSGVGALTKTGGKQLTVAGDVALDGGFIVEEGTLVLSNVTDTEFTKLSVAEGAALDLNGASVTVDEYVVGGVKQRSGTYTAHNGTIRVKYTGPAGRKAIIR